MANDKHTCENCRWCYEDELDDWICVNCDSDYCSDWVTEETSCDEWEPDNDDN